MLLLMRCDCLAMQGFNVGNWLLLERELLRGQQNLADVPTEVPNSMDVQTMVQEDSRLQRVCRR